MRLILKCLVVLVGVGVVYFTLDMPGIVQLFGQGYQKVQAQIQLTATTCALTILSVLVGWVKEPSAQKLTKISDPSPIPGGLNMNSMSPESYEMVSRYARRMEDWAEEIQKSSAEKHKQLEAELDEGQKELRCAQHVIYFAALIALASCIATVMFPPNQSIPFQHSFALGCAYIVTGGIFGGIGAIYLRSTKLTVIRVGFLASALTGIVVLLVTVPYSIESWQLKEIGGVGVSLLTWITVARLLVLPLFAAASYWSGRAIVKRLLRDA